MKNIITISMLVFIEALQFLIIVALFYSFIPIPVPVFVQKLYPLSQYDVRLERESYFYHIWILTALVLQGVMLYINRRRLGEEKLWHHFLPYVCTMGAIIFAQIFFIFKIFLWGNPWWARDLFYAFLGLGILIRIFWPEFWRLTTKIWKLVTSASIPRWGYFLMEAAGLLMLVFLVFTPDMGKVLDRMFSYDRFYHFDIFLMSPAWGYHNGLVLNGQVITNYSLIIPIIFSTLMTWMGTFDYGQAVGLMIGFVGIYYLLIYGLLRYWLKSALLALIATILAIKLQFFHWGVFPLIWIYPSANPLRYFPDIFFLFFLLRFAQGFQWRWLAAGALAVGIGIDWSLDVGVYMYGTLGIAVLGYAYVNKKRLVFSKKALPLVFECASILLMPVVVALGILLLCYGPMVLHSEFWHNTFEFASFFLQGWGSLPMTDGLRDKQFFAFCMGFLMPVAYLGTLLYCLGVFLFRQSRQHLFMVLICVYGLGIYHYFIYRSAVTSYYVAVIPLIFVLMFWAQALLKLCKDHWQTGLKIILFIWVLTALSTSVLFTFYPNRLNLSSYDWTPENKYYVDNFDFKQDAMLIDSLTSPTQPVALISSFETKILIQANRRPFFYYFPLMESEHMDVEQKRGLHLYTYSRLKTTLDQLQNEMPSPIFIERRLIEASWAPSYEDNHLAFKQLMAFIRQHYQYQDRGQYLAAFKLK